MKNLKKLFSGIKVKGLPVSAFRNRKTTTGFTLIELLVVISIIALLSSVILASLSTAREKAKVSTTISAMMQIKNAAELYRNDNGAYPTAMNQLLAGNYLPSAPISPFTGTSSYMYIGYTTYYYKLWTENNDRYCTGATLDLANLEVGKFYVTFVPTGARAGLFSKYEADMNIGGWVLDTSSPCFE